MHDFSKTELYEVIWRPCATPDMFKDRPPSVEFRENVNKEENKNEKPKKLMNLRGGNKYY